METLNNPKIIRAWCMYDWANSVYSLTITTAVFPIYYSTVTSSEGSGNKVNFFGIDVENTVLYSYALAMAFLLVSFINPMLSGISDYSGRKKSFMRFFALMGSVACAGLFFFKGPNIETGIILFVLAGMGYAGSLVFYNAYLPEIATKDKYDSISAKGFAYGYVGSVLLLIVNLIVIQFPHVFGISDGGLPARLSFLMVGIWWFVFSMFAFRGLPKDKAISRLNTEVLLRGYRELKKVYTLLRSNDYLMYFLYAFFLYSMGFQTIMYMASIFGESELHIPTQGLIITVLLIQLVAIGGAWFFSKSSSRYGNINTLFGAILLCLLVCVAAYNIQTENQFYALAVLVGLVMGGIQSLSRSTYAKLLPPTEDHASYFSFYELSEKVATVLGTASYGLIIQLTGSMRNSVFVLGLLFVAGMVFLVIHKRASRLQV